MVEQKDLFDWKHLKLWRFSTIAETLASIVVVVYVLLAFGEAYRYNSIAHSQYQTDLFGLFSREPIYVLDILLQMARVFFQGAVYYVLLKGVALGLTMIVETDINYRDQEQDEVGNG